jgi:hypothetical protein
MTFLAWWFFTMFCIMCLLFVLMTWSFLRMKETSEGWRELYLQLRKRERTPFG